LRGAPARDAPAAGLRYTITTKCGAAGTPLARHRGGVSRKVSTTGRVTDAKCKKTKKPPPPLWQRSKKVSFFRVFRWPERLPGACSFLRHGSARGGRERSTRPITPHRRMHDQEAVRNSCEYLPRGFVLTPITTREPRVPAGLERSGAPLWTSWCWERECWLMRWSPGSSRAFFRSAVSASAPISRVACPSCSRPGARRWIVWVGLERVAADYPRAKNPFSPRELWRHPGQCAGRDARGGSERERTHPVGVCRPAPRPARARRGRHRKFDR